MLCLRYLYRNFFNLKTRVKQSPSLILSPRTEEMLNIDESDGSNNSLSSEMYASNIINNSRLNNSELTNYKMNVKTRIHDIKTPLNNIVLAINSDDNISEENKLNIIENAYLIKDLLNDLLKNENNLEDFKYNPKKISIVKLTKKIEILINSELKTHDKKINISLLEIECDFFTGDEKLIIRLLINLIKNSLKYQSELFSDIKLVVENVLKNQNLITRFVIIDNNDELPEQIQTNIFKPFNTTNNSGLGLYICKRIVDLHNGKIEYKRIDNTNNFLITFQTQMVTTLFNDSDSSSSEKSGKVLRRIKKLVSKSQFDLTDKKKILLIDDCLVTLKLMKFIIKKIDINNRYVVNTLSQIEKEFYTEKNKQKLLSYDIIITDFQIGNVTCLEFLSFLNAKNEYNGKLYCITGNEDIEIVTRLQKKVDQIYFKPVKYENLKLILNYT